LKPRFRAAPAKICGCLAKTMVRNYARGQFDEDDRWLEIGASSGYGRDYRIG
jgi:hypothetical protein